MTDIIWAPWRMEYIVRAGDAREEGCFLCLPPGSAGPDRDRLILYSDETVVVMLNRYPYTSGHLLIAPRRHIPTLADADEAERLALMNQAARATEILAGLLGARGFNLGINQGRVSGGSVEAHLHLHVTPRYQGDANFMTVLGATRVISESLAAAYDKLAPAFLP